LLPGSLLAYSARQGALIPHFLTPRDEVWLRRLLGEAAEFAGRTVAEWGRASSDVWFARAVAEGARPRAARGVLYVLGKLYKARIDSAVPPARARQAVFDHAVRVTSRAEALDAAARELGIDVVSVERALFADRASRRRLVAPAAWPGPRELAERYNLRLAQGLLLRARGVAVHVTTHVRSAVRFAKLRRLLCVYEPRGEGTVLRISGPLSILRQTTKYGHALASFLPAVIATPGWSLDADCELGGEPARLALTSADPLGAAHALPRESDSGVEAQLVRDVRRLGTTWSIERETAALRLVAEDGTPRLFFPDFTLVRGDDRVLVEIVGFYTREYLASKVRALRALTGQRILVCVDESLGIADAIDAGAVLRYRRRVDARVLLAEAERLVVQRQGSPGEGSDTTST
jgi:predicted nuclease of restriction endonuclease-like RecB superfamily